MLAVDVYAHHEYVVTFMFLVLKPQLGHAQKPLGSWFY